ncbi:nucleolar/coiled-body phosphoprotein isoform X2 [Carex rostrata]
MNKNQSLIQFTPRQVVMALESQSAKKEKKEKKEKKNSKKGSSEAVEGSKEIILNGGDLSARGKGREVLLRSIAGFLESNGFKKTLAVFQSEAQIGENSWKSPDVNLNEFAAKLSESSSFLAVPAIGSDKLEEKETEKKTRKKSTKGSSIEQSADEKTAPEKSKLVDGEQQHEKKEKKKKRSSEELKPVEEEREEANQKKKNKKEEKDKKKKKKKESEVEKETQEEEEKETQEEEEKEKANVKETNVENEEKTVSKKRKKGDEENVEHDSKKRKFEANGTVETSPDEEQSAEPNSAKAFKRVKVEEVKFVDERLQDNSYWAKDGADSGYGAKAQQILEQVRGRDFRHEKTKKKRGTYRGGQIDLQSHSIKFNYSDEE